MNTVTQTFKKKKIVGNRVLDHKNLNHPPRVFNTGRWYMRATGTCVCARACEWQREGGRQQPYGSFWCSWCFTYRLNHDPLSAPSHRHPHIHTHFSPLLFLSCTLHPLHPSSLTYRLSPPLPPPLLVRHTHKNAQDMLTLGYGAVVLYRGKSAGARGGFGVNGHTWLS